MMQIKPRLHVCILALAMLFINDVLSQGSGNNRVDSIKAVIQNRYAELAKAFNTRNLDTILAFRTKDFRIYGPAGDMQDYPMSIDNTRYFLTNNVPPYHIKNTILRIKVSPNNLIAIADVQQESLRKRELAGKLRDVRVLAEQTETWVLHDGKWLVQAVENIHNRKRYVDGKRVSDDPNAPYDPNAPEYVDPTELPQGVVNNNAKGAKKPDTKDSATVRFLLLQFDKMVEAFVKDDMLAVAKFYADDAIVASGRFEVKGRRDIDNYWMSLKGKGKDWKLITNSIEIIGDVALHDGISVLTHLSSGKEQVSKTRFLVVWQKGKDGIWKISKDYYAGY
ncbi:MAG TPA: nuclear transport factor 2 family protein [Chitinophagaceae bacterium]|nr:nuclear transport factor 2 family protein [Chitinophagaceae bacterium]